MSEQIDRLLTVADVAEIVGLSEYTIRQAIRDGELAATTLRRRLRITTDDLAAWIDNGRQIHRPRPASRVRDAASAHHSDMPAVTADNVREVMRRQRRNRAA